MADRSYSEVLARFWPDGDHLLRGDLAANRAFVHRPTRHPKPSEGLRTHGHPSESVQNLVEQHDRMRVWMARHSQEMMSEIAAPGILALCGILAPTQSVGLQGPLPKQSAITQLEEIIVTARRREETANKVGMAITAASGETLRKRGIESLADLSRLVPGLTIQQSAFNSTSFTLRGVGFFNSDLGTPPAVTVYVDEAPLPYPAMTKLVAFDLDRVEVLKGPQGTLYGENATGGAIDYIAAKPTNTFHAGADATFGRFSRGQLGGFLSGPVNDQLLFRLAMQGHRAGPWQESITRPSDKLGRIRELQGRATLEWHPDTRVKSRLTLTVTHDGSDSRAAQFIAPTIQLPALATPGLVSFPVVTRPRSADWTPVRDDNGRLFPYGSNTTLYHAVWRTDYNLRDNVTLTSLSSYAHFHLAYGQDPDGTPFHVDEVIDHEGRVSDFFQELRVAGSGRLMKWLFGANYTHDRIRDEPVEFFRDNDVAHLFQGFDPEAVADESSFKGRIRVTTFAAFSSVEINPAQNLMIEGALRYNVDHRTFDNCGFAITDHFVRFWNLIRGGAPPPIQLGGCYVLDPANGFQPVDNVHSKLNQKSLSWRAGVNWSPKPTLLIFANVSKGYKSGAVPVLGASTVAQFKPVPQESLLAYEAGIKAGLFDRHVQLNASAFYYDYRDKQLRGALLDPTFGPLEALLSIPKSHADGIDAQLVARPLPGLMIDASATYTRTEIDRFVGFDALARFGDQSGTPFPFSPKFQSVVDAEQDFPLTARIKAFVGGSLIHDSKTYAGVGARDLMRLDPFTLLDLRAGLQLDDGRYNVWFWGKNVTNKYYWTNVFATGNAVARFPGNPATYGVSLSARF